MYIFSLSFFTNNNPEDIKTIEIAILGDNNCKIFNEEAEHLKLQAEGGAFWHAIMVPSLLGFSHSILMLFRPDEAVIVTFLSNICQLRIKPFPIIMSSMSSEDCTTSLLFPIITGNWYFNACVWFCRENTISLPIISNVIDSNISSHFLIKSLTESDKRIQFFPNPSEEPAVSAVDLTQMVSAQ